MGTFTRIETKAPADRQKAPQSGTFTRISTGETITRDAAPAPERAKAGRGGSFVKISAPAGTASTLVKAKTEERAVGGNRNGNIRTATVQIPTQQELANRLEQQRAEWMEPISQRAQIPQIPQVPQLTLPAVTPVFSTPEVRNKAGRAVMPKAEESPRHVPEKHDTRAAGLNDGFWTRLGNTLKGGGKGILADHMDTTGTLYQGGQGYRTAVDGEILAGYRAGADQAERELEELLAQDGLSAGAVLADLPQEEGFFSTKRRDYLTAAGVRNTEDVLAAVNVLEDYRRKAEAMEQAMGAQPQAGEAARGLAAEVKQSGARDIERAKMGKGMVQNILVDAAASMVQTAGDAAVNTILGTPQSMIPLAFRAFGGGAMEARQAGGTLEQQGLTGTAVAAKEVITEMLFGMSLPFSKAYGGGALDDVVKRGIAKAVERYAKTEVGKRVLGGGLTFAVSALSEGAEEFIGDWMEWQMPHIYGGQPVSFEENLENSLYDFLVGSAAGAMGGAVSPDTYSYKTAENGTGTAGQAAESAKSASKQEKAASQGAAGMPRITMEDFTNPESPVWNNVEYDDTATQVAITQTVHREMVEAGEVVRIPDSTTQQTAESFPDLRSMKKSERNPILRQKIDVLRASLKQFLEGLKGTSYAFEVNGSVLEARLYNTGIQEVLEKLNQSKTSMLYHSDEIFRTAKYLYSTPDYSSNPNIYRWNYFYAPVQIGDEVVGVRIAIRDMKQTANSEAESQIYNWGIKKGPALDGGGPGMEPLSAGASSAEPMVEDTYPLNSDIIIPQDAESVKFQGTDGMCNRIVGKGAGTQKNRISMCAGKRYCGSVVVRIRKTVQQSWPVSK